MRLPCIVSAVWLQLQWVKPRLGLLTIHSLRLASGGGSPTFHSVCSCNAAVLRAEEWEVWWCVRERFRKRGEGMEKRTEGEGGQVNERGKKENILRLLSLQKVCWNNGQQRTVWRNKVTIQVYEGVLLTWCKFVLLWKMLTLRAFVKGGPCTTDYIPALHGTICQHKTATKQASDTCSSS